MNYRKNFFIACGIWCGVLLLCFFWLFPWLSGKMSSAKSEAIESRKQLLEYIAERDNLRKAEESLDLIEASELRPDDFLPGENSLVSEIKFLESWAESLNLSLKVKISGSVAGAKKADTKGSSVLIPLALEFRGALPETLEFLHLLESATLPFVSDRLTVSQDNGAGKGSVFVTLEGNVYLKK